MDSQVVNNTPIDRRSDRPEATFISGWFTQQFEAGKKPNYGYPVNHLPETSGRTMEVVTGFVNAVGK